MKLMTIELGGPQHSVVAIAHPRPGLFAWKAKLQSQEMGPNRN
jgi:hypothetical protein